MKSQSYLFQDESGSISDIARVVVAELTAEGRKQTLEEDVSEEVSVVAEEEVADLEEQFGPEDCRRSILEETLGATGKTGLLSEVEDEVSEETHLLFRDRVQIRISQPSQDIGKCSDIFNMCGVSCVIYDVSWSLPL